MRWTKGLETARWLPEAGWWHANAAGSPGVRLSRGRARTWARGRQPPSAPAAGRSAADREAT